MPATYTNEGGKTPILYTSFSQGYWGHFYLKYICLPISSPHRFSPNLFLANSHPPVKSPHHTALTPRGWRLSHAFSETSASFRSVPRHSATHSEESALRPLLHLGPNRHQLASVALTYSGERVNHPSHPESTANLCCLWFWWLWHHLDMISRSLDDMTNS